MSFALLLVALANGQKSEFDGKYVKEYDPAYIHPEGYMGGKLEVTGDIKEAMAFPDQIAAFAKWKESYGIRPDGEPNRPLTAWTATVMKIPEEEDK